MEYKRSSLMPLSVLIVGLSLAWGLLLGLTRIAEVFRYKDFAYRSSESTPAQNVTALPGNRFVMVAENSITLFRVDAKGKLVVEDRTEKQYVEKQGDIYTPSTNGES